MQNGGEFNDRRKEWSGKWLWPRLRREKKKIVERGLSRFRNQQKLGIEGEMDLCQEESERRKRIRSQSNLLIILRWTGIRSEVGIFRREGMVIFLAEVTSESTVSMPRMPTSFETTINSTVLWDKKRRWMKYLIELIIEEVDALKELDYRDTR